MKKWAIPSWVQSFKVQKPNSKKAKAASKGPEGFVYVLGSRGTSAFSEIVQEHALTWQIAGLKKNEKEVLSFTGQKGPVWVVRVPAPKETPHQSMLSESSYAWVRDQIGALVSAFKPHQLKYVNLHFWNLEEEQQLAALTGLEIASYQFRAFMDGKALQDLPEVSVQTNQDEIPKEVMKEAQVRGKAVNTARHLVNLPPNLLHPESFAWLAQQGLGLPKTLKVSVWNKNKLAQEKMGLHLAVGQGAQHGPCMVHLRYRPKKASRKKPIAFVGKGITFDTGGLDIKPSSAMRLMKKDMGGAASVLALALWVAESEYERACDFYLALAENAVDADSFRPSDIVVARNGLKVEIDNTDAEGRLVLADCLDVAVKQKGADEPEFVIDVATLTGAIKVGLGAEIAGLFANDDQLGDALNRAGQQAGDLNWRMPLFDKYFSALSSPFADFKNSGDGFGGAITAALFLQKFVQGKKWAHLDVYAWTDKAQGAFAGAGGSGQPVQCLITFLQGQV